jgi:hypothetical protein
MTTYARRAPLLAVVFTTGVAVALSLGGSIPAPAAHANNQPKPPGKPTWVGAIICQDCHNLKDQEAQDNPLQKQTRGFEFIRLSENRIWGTHDLHAKAFENLNPATNATARRMDTNLKALRGNAYDVTTDVSCLACHASHKKLMSDEPPEKWTKDSFSRDEGVGCEMCHGHGSAYQEEHRKSVQIPNPVKGGPVRTVPWREWSPAVKLEWGLVNLRDPLVATARCASCHVGNKQEGRFVTHEMFAAGHPPLPPLDFMGYAREQPRHWGWPNEMKYLTDLAKSDAKKAMDVFHFRGGETFGTRRFVETTVAALRATADCTDQLAAEAKKNDEWGLDFAAFDCFSCHHDLKYPSDRQARGYTGRPGRPLFRPAPFALARIVVAHAATLDGAADLAAAVAELDKAEKALADSCARRAFGDPALVAPAAKAIAAWCDATLKKLAAVRYDDKATHSLLAAVTRAATDAKSPVADPEVAQLYCWAIETLVLELEGPPRDSTKPPAVLARMNEQLKGVVVTRLRPNAPFYYEQRVEGGIAAPNQEAVDARIKSRMATIYGFRGDVFRDVLGKLEPSFPKPK